MDLYEWLTDYYAPLRNCAQRTIDLYRQTIDRYKDFLGRTPTLVDLNDITVSRFLQARLRDNLSPATVAKDRAQLAGLWNVAARRKLVPEFPTLPNIRTPQRAPIAWQMEQVATIFATIDQLRGKVGDYPARHFWRALLMTIWDTGERIGAIRQLRIEHLDHARGMLTIPAEVRKNKTRDLVIELSPETLFALMRIIDINEPRRLIFVWPLCYTYLHDRYTKILKMAGLPSDCRSKFHRIRRTVASYYTLSGGNATQLLDHSNPAVTKKYIDPTIVRPSPPHSLLPKLPPAQPPRHSPSPADEKQADYGVMKRPRGRPPKTPVPSPEQLHAVREDIKKQLGDQA